MTIFSDMIKTDASICLGPILDSALIRKAGRPNVRVLRVNPVQGEPH